MGSLTYRIAYRPVRSDTSRTRRSSVSPPVANGAASTVVVVVTHTVLKSVCVVVRTTWLTAALLMAFGMVMEDIAMLATFDILFHQLDT